MKSKNPWITILLNLILPGLSYVYLGALKRFAILWVILVSTYCLMGLSGFLKMPSGIYFAFGILFAIVIFSYVDCFRLAKITEWNHQTSYTKTPFYIFLVIVCLSLIYFIKLKVDRSVFGIGYFKMTHNNFAPELKAGDGIIIDFDAFKNEKPKAGDLVVIEIKDVLYVRVLKVLQPNQDTVFARFKEFNDSEFPPRREVKSEAQVRESMRNFNILKEDSNGTIVNDIEAKEEMIKNSANPIYLEPVINKFSYPVGGKLVGKVISIYISDDFSRIGKL